MAGKRQATTNLNHDNWDHEDDEPEEKGIFQTAPEDELKSRVIKRARRRMGDASDGTSGNTPTSSVFSGFTGFGKTTAAGSVSSGAWKSSPFSLLSKLPDPKGTISSDTTTVAVTPAFSFGSAKNVKSNDTETKISSSETVKSANKSENYYAKLKGLNQAVTDWIKTHVDKNPLCILTPIFKDYEKHLSGIEKEEDIGTNANKLITESEKNKPSNSTSTLETFKFSGTVTSTTSTSSSNGNGVITATKPTPTIFFGMPNSSSPFTSTSTPTTGGESAVSAQKPTTSIFGGMSKSANEPVKSNGFSFGLKSDDKNSAVGSSTSITSSFSFGKAAGDDAKPSGFSVPFSFGNLKPPPPGALATKSESATAEEDDNDEPPKVEFKQVIEKDANFSKKCKVYVKKEGNFVERGVGTLYLKPVKDSEKTQLLVRADTNLGNILINLILAAAIPVKRMGKNNVMLVCLPTPDEEKPTSVLLRVKTGEEADELFETIEKHKK